MKTDAGKSGSRFHSSNNEGIFRGASPSRLEEKAKQLEPLLLSALLRFPESLDTLPETFGASQFFDPDARDLAGRLIEDRYEHGELCPGTVLAELKAGTARDRELASYAASLLLPESQHAVPNAAGAPRWARAIHDAWSIREKRNAHAEVLERINNATCLQDVYQAEDAYRDTIRKLDDLANRESPFNFLSCAELDAGDFTIEYLVDNVLVKGQPCVVAGAEKTLKTSLLVALSLALSLCERFLDKFWVTKRQRVLFMSGESGLGTLQETARRIAQSMGHDLKDIDGAFFSGNLPSAGNASELRALARDIERHQADVVMIDPMYLCLPGDDAGNVFRQGELLRRIHRPCAEAGATMLLAHHNKTTGTVPGRPAKLSDIAWAGFQEFARGWLLLSRREPYEEGTGSHRLWLTVGGSAGHSGLWALDIEEGTNNAAEGRMWDVRVATGRDERQAAERRREQKANDKEQRTRDLVKRKLAEALKQYPDGQTKSTLASAIGRSNTKAGEAIHTLLVEGRIELCTIQKKNGQNDGFRLTPAGWKYVGGQ